jgi:hypothetical protein
VKEASAVRVSSLSPFARLVSFLWEVPVQLITYTAGQFLSGGALKRIDIKHKF